MKKFFIINLPVYNIDLAISVGQDDKDFKRSIYRVWNIPENDFSPSIPEYAQATTLCLDLDGVYVPYCIRFKNHPKKDGTAGHKNIAHEALHATYRILRSRGLHLTYESEEAFTYLLGHIVEQIYNNL